MKCNACGASWDESTVKQTLLACPFCGEVLEKKKPKKTRKKNKKEKTLKDVLREIIGLKGEEILEDKDVTIGLLSDLAPKMTKERRQLGMMYDIGAIKTIQSASHKTKTEQQRACKKISKQLSTDLDMEEDAAEDLAAEVCTAVYGRKMSAAKQKKGSALSGAKMVSSAEGETASEKEVQPSNTTGDEPAEKKTKKKTPAKQSSTSSNSATPSVSGGQTASGTKPVISHAKAARPSQKSVLAGASMVKSQQTLQQAALPPKGQGSSTNSSGNSSGNASAGRGRKKSSTTKKTTSRKTSSGQNTTTYNTGNSQSNWQPTPQQLQAYQYYTGKPYPQSAVPQSSGYQPWAPSYQPQSRNSSSSYSGRRSQNTQGNGQGYQNQQNNVGSFQSRIGSNVNTGYASSSVSQWLQPAMNGDKAAMYQLGLQYLRGTDGIAQDTNEGLKWITGAANKGEENAQFMLGYLYYSGTEIPKNESEALKWFLKCVRPRDFEVHYIIGMIYAYGTSMTPNYTEAFKWFYRAAKGGNVQAQFIMGEFYHNGYDMEVNEKEAENWYAKAAKNGHAKAQQMLNQLNYGTASQSHPSMVSSSAIPPSMQEQISQAVQQAVEQTVRQVRQQQSAISRSDGASSARQNQNQSARSPQSQRTQQHTQNSWQRQIGGNADSATRAPGWRQNYNLGVVSSNRNYQTLPSESQFTLGQSYTSKVNRKLLQEDEDDDWLNISRKNGFSGSQT